MDPRPRRARRDRRARADEPHDRLPLPKLCTANIQVDQGAALLCCSVEVAEAAGVDRRPLDLPRVGGRGHRPLVHLAAARPVAIARHRPGRPDRSRAGRARDRRHRGGRPLFVLPRGGPDGGPGARDPDRRRRAPAHPDRRTHLRRGPRQQLHHPRHRLDRRGAASPFGIDRHGDRPRLVRDQARHRRLRGASRRRAGSAPRTSSGPSTPSSDARPIPSRPATPRSRPSPSSTGATVRPSGPSWPPGPDRPAEGGQT